MKLYLASSWKNELIVTDLAEYLRVAGHEVDAFCDTSTGRLSFNWAALTDVEHETLNAKTALEHPVVQQAFAEDKKWLDWAEGVVLVLPSGKSAHLEAGYTVGQGKPVWCYAPNGFPPGDMDVMYGFFQGLFTSRYALAKALGGSSSRRG
jgi:hypothetical protein